jgi:hypothetical protein
MAIPYSELEKRLRAEVAELKAERDQAYGWLQDIWMLLDDVRQPGETVPAAVARLKAEVAQFRERAERERDAVAEACLTRYSNDRWGVTVRNYAVGTFDSRDAAIREMLEFVALDAAPAGEGPPP